jgi:hypothetical protein
MIRNPFSRRAHESAGDTRQEGAVALILFLLLGLVFAPIVGLHVAMVAGNPQPAVSGADDLAHHAVPPGRPSRG